MTKPHSLSAALQELHKENMLQQADLIAGWPAGPERDAAAMTHVRSALWEQSMGRISEDTKYRIYSTLHFVMPDDAVWQEEPTPNDVLDRQVEWELAYQKQLIRQTCEECGDGVCPGAEVE